MKQQHRIYTFSKCVSWCIFSLLFSPYFTRVEALVKGSTTSLSLEDLVIFPASDTNNTMTGFAWFKKGFTLEDNTTSCTFNAAFPVSGDITLNNGTLILLNDMDCAGAVNILSFGTIIGNANTLDLSSTITYVLASRPDTLEDVTLAMHANITCSGPLRIRGECIIDGNNNGLVFSDTADIALESGAKLTLRDIKLQNLSGNKIRCLDESGIITLDNAVCALDSDFTFTQGSFNFVNVSQFINPYTFSYESVQTSTISKNASCLFSGGSTFSIGRGFVSGPEPLYLVDQTSVLDFNNANLSVTDAGMQLTNGVMKMEGNVTIDVATTDTTKGLHFGDGIASHDLAIELHSTAHANFNSGAIILDLVKQHAITSHSEVGRITRGGTSVFVRKHDIEFRDVFFSRSPLSSSIIENGAQAYVSNITTALLNGGEAKITGTVDSPISFLLGGDGLLVVSNGIYPLMLNVANTNNRIEGTGSVSGPIILSDPTAELVAHSAGTLKNIVMLNGGSLHLEKDLVFSENGSIASSGTIDLASYELSISAKNSQSSSDIYWDGTAGRISLQSTFSLANTWTFSGNCTIDGQGNSLTFTTGGNIVVDKNSTLKLKNIRVANIGNANIRCLFDSGTIALEDVVWMQDADYSFTKGALDISSHVESSGSYTFEYDSVHTSTINLNAQWCFLNDMCLKIGRKVGSDREPLYLVNNTSQLILADACFEIASGGMQLAGGSILLDREVFLNFNSTSTLNGFELGNGVDSNACIEFAPGATVIFGSGHFVYNVPSLTNIHSRSKSSKIIRSSGNYVHVKENLVLRNIAMDTDDNTAITFEAGKSLSYDNVLVVAPDYEFDLTGHRYNAFTHLLNGDDSIFLARGAQPAAVIASGTGNKIHGTGNQGQLIVLSDESSELEMNLAGMLLKDVQLNGGQLSLRNETRLASEKVIEGPGAVFLNGISLDVGSANKVWSTPIFWDSDEGKINLNSKVSLSTTWTFSGTCTIDGKGNVLSLIPGGQIVLARDAKVIFKNMRIDHSADQDISCHFDSNAIVLDSVQWLQDGDFTFSVGSIEFKNKVEFGGTYTFNYQSSQTSTVQPSTQWRFNDGMKLSIGRKVGSSREPLYLVDSTSELNLNNAIFSISQGGLQLGHGKLSFGRDVILEFAGTTTMEGFELGNGVDSDVIAHYYPGATVKFGAGYFIYNVPVNNAVRSESKISRIVRQPGSLVYLKKSLHISNLSMDTDDNTQITLEDGVSLTYDNIKVVAPDYEFDLTAQRYDPFTNLLAGDGDIFLSKGVQPAVTLIMGSGNKIHGNGSMGQLIMLSDANASVDIGIEGSLLNTLALNTGTVNILGDIQFGNDGVITGPGVVNLPGIALELGSKDSVWNTPIYWNSDESSINLKAKISLSNTWTFSGTCTIDGHGNALSLVDGGRIVLARDAKVTFKNLRIDHSAGQDICCHFDSNAVVLDNVQWLQDGDFTFSMGSLEFKNSVDFGGTYTFNYQSSQTSTVRPSTQWRFNDGMKLAIGRKVGTNHEPLCLADSTSELNLNHAIFHVNQGGLQLAHGKLSFGREVMLELSGTTSMDGFELGDGVSDDVVIQYYPGASVTFGSGYFIYNVPVPNAIQSETAISRIIRKAGSFVHLKKDLHIANLSIDTDINTQITLEDGVALSYENVKVIAPDYEFDLTANRYNAFTNLLMNGGNMFLSKGVQPAVTLVMGASNKIHGTGSMGQLITLFDANAQIDLGIEGSILNTLALNTGMANMMCNIMFGNDGIITGPGIVTLPGVSLELGSKDATWNTPIFWDSDEGSINLNAKVSLSNTWTFSGQCTINGQGNVLSLDPGGSIVLARDTKLIFKNIRLEHSSGADLAPHFDSNQILLDNVQWLQDGDFTFSMGSLEFNNFVDFGGSYTFRYESSQTSTVRATTKWHFDDGMKLVIGRQVGSEREPLYMIDDTSELSLAHATFCISSGGMRLSRGRLAFDRKVTVEFNSTSTLNGFELGDGVATDVEIEFHPGAAVIFKEGHFVYNVPVPTAVASRARSSRIIREAGNILHLNQNIILSNISIETDYNTNLTTEPGKAFIYENAVIVDRDYKFNITGQRYNAFTHLLGGDGNIFISKGVQPAVVLAMGIGNKIHGTGAMGQLITLFDTNTVVTFDLEGHLLNNIALNEGKICIDSDLHFASNATLVGPGRVELNGNTLSMGNKDNTLAGSIYWDGSGGVIELNSKFTLSDTWTFSGAVEINGGGNSLCLGAGGKLAVERGSQLLLKNVRVESVGNENIYCLDDAAQIVINNSRWDLVASSSFSRGGLDVFELFDMRGSYTLYFETIKTCTINSLATWRLYEGTTLSYGPAVPDRDLIYFADSSSMLSLNNATLHATTTGIQLKRGTLKVKGSCYLASDGRSPFEGVWFGDGVSSDQDIDIDIFPESNLALRSGYAVYKNVDA